MSSTSKRTFTVEKSDIGASGGVYVSSAPYTAASKAAAKLFKEDGAAKKSKIRFTLRETTRGEGGKQFQYIGVKETLDAPIVRQIGNTTVEYKHKYSVKSCSSTVA